MALITNVGFVSQYRVSRKCRGVSKTSVCESVCLHVSRSQQYQQLYSGPVRVVIGCQGHVVLAYGIGVDSTAMLIELVARGETPDLVLTADTGSEKPATYDYLDIIRRWMEAHGIEFQICP